MPPPGPVKIGHKKDGRQRQPHRFHVSRPPPLSQSLDPLLTVLLHFGNRSPLHHRDALFHKLATPEQRGIPDGFLTSRGYLNILGSQTLYLFVAKLYAPLVLCN